MKFLRPLVAALAVCFAYTAHAQVAVPPFPGLAAENFDALVPGAYAGFAGFGGIAGFSRIGLGGALAVTNAPGLQPPLSVPNSMFGRGVDVRIRFTTFRKRFGGYFRVPFAGIPVTAATFQFFQGALPVGVPVAAPVNMFGYVWIGWDLGPLGGFDRVEIYGNGGPLGYVGMDNLVVI